MGQGQAGNGHGPDNGGPLDATPQTPLATITMTLMRNGMVNVSWPNDEVITRFLLDKGAEAIRDGLKARNAPLVTPAGGANMPNAADLMRGLKRLTG